jgi:hypothetical protein
MLVTAWGDDGQECPFDANWPALCLFADGVYDGDGRIGPVKSRLRAVTGADFDAFVRIGGLKARLETMRARLLQYVSGGSRAIEELDDPPVREFDDVSAVVLPHADLATLCRRL